jgi:hypothetical protein
MITELLEHSEFTAGAGFAQEAHLHMSDHLKLQVLMTRVTFGSLSLRLPINNRPSHLSTSPNTFDLQYTAVLPSLNKFMTLLEAQKIF